MTANGVSKSRPAPAFASPKGANGRRLPAGALSVGGACPLTSGWVTWNSATAGRESSQGVFVPRRPSTPWRDLEVKVQTQMATHTRTAPSGSPSPVIPTAPVPCSGDPSGNSDEGGDQRWAGHRRLPDWQPLALASMPSVSRRTACSFVLDGALLPQGPGQYRGALLSRRFGWCSAVLAATILGLSGPARSASPPIAKLPSRSVVRVPAGYEMPSVVAESIWQNGVHLDGRIQSVLRVGCEGVGLPGGPRQDRAGITEATYHIFVCSVTTRAVRLAHAKVLWWSNNTYRYDFFGCKRGRGCA
jgi:hypothetical protein